MSTESGANRWWENYLVRYLMPSIAGIAIVGWILHLCGPDLRPILFLPANDQPVTTASLTLIFLYGNLFCYIASFPILIFHVTRVIDFSAPNGKDVRANLFSGYLCAFAVLMICLGLTRWASPHENAYGASIVGVAFSFFQFVRLYRAHRPVIKLRGVDDYVSPAFGFAFSLAKRRGLISTEERSLRVRKTIAWRQDFIASYRHLREHGNAAFIFMLEITLALLVYCATRVPTLDAPHQLAKVGTVFAIWAAPAVFVHLVGQHLERRFSQFDRRMAEADTKPTRRDTGETTAASSSSVEVTIVKWPTRSS